MKTLSLLVTFMMITVGCDADASDGGDVTGAGQHHHHQQLHHYLLHDGDVGGVGDVGASVMVKRFTNIAKTNVKYHDEEGLMKVNIGPAVWACTAFSTRKSWESFGTLRKYRSGANSQTIDLLHDDTYPIMEVIELGGEVSKEEDSVGKDSMEEDSEGEDSMEEDSEGKESREDSEGEGSKEEDSEGEGSKEEDSEGEGSKEEDSEDKGSMEDDLKGELCLFLDEQHHCYPPEPVSDDITIVMQEEVQFYYARRFWGSADDARVKHEVSLLKKSIEEKKITDADLTTLYISHWDSHVKEVRFNKIKK